MLTSIILHLQSQADGRIHGGSGRAIHAFWFDQWRQVDPGRAAALHQSSQVRPFTLSPLMGLPAPRRGQTRIAAGQQAWLRCTTLQNELSRALLESWLPRLPAAITLLDLPWRVQSLSLAAQEHPWAGQTRYADLWQAAFAPGAPRPDAWRFAFLTPTAFHADQETHLPFPLPEALLASWLRRWQAFAPPSLSAGLPPLADLRRLWRQGLQVSAYDLKTVPVSYGRRTTIGCVGHYTLRANRLDPDARALVSLLAAYAFYCGSGHHTTQGMGQTRLTIDD